MADMIQAALPVAVMLAIFPCTFANGDVTIKPTCGTAVLRNLGCWKDKRAHLMPEYLNALDPDLLKIPRKDRPRLVIKRCAMAAQRRGYEVFGVQYGYRCYSSPIAKRTYKRLGRGYGCARHGRGGYLSNQVYAVPKYDQVSGIPFPTKFKSLGCWKDKRNKRAISPLEGKDKILDGKFRERVEAFRKCYEAARRRGYKIFALRFGGWCASDMNAGYTYRKYGRSSACQADGKGGANANEVYEITE